MAATTVYSGINGRVTFYDGDSIEDVTDNGATVTIDLTGHNFSAGDPVYIYGVVGMTDLNGYHSIDSVNTNDITITVTTAQSYTSGGVVQHTIPMTSWTLNQTCEIKDYTDSSCVSSSVAWAKCVSSVIKRFEGSIEGIFGDGTTRPTIGTKILYYFYMNGSDSFYGNSRITGENITQTDLEGDVTKISYTFKGGGELTEANS